MGLSYFYGTRWMHYPELAEMHNAVLHSLGVAADGTVWGIRFGSAFWFDGKEWGIASDLADLNVGTVLSLTAGPDSTVGVGSARGLSHFDGMRWTYYPLDMRIFAGSSSINAEGITTLAVARFRLLH